MRYLFFFLFFISFQTYAQNYSQIDSIRKRIVNSQSDSLKAIEYLEIANRHKQKDSVFSNLKLSLDFARKAEIPKYISNSRVNLSNWYNNYESRDASIKEHLRAIKELEKYDFKSGIANHYIRLGYRYNSTNQDSANHYIAKGVNLAKEAKDDNVILTGLLALGNRAFYNQKFDKALAYYIEGEEICRKNPKLTNSIKHASTLEYIGYVMQRNKQYKKAIQYFRESLAIYEKSANYKGVANMQTNIAEQYFETKEYEKAIPLLNKTIQYNNTYSVQKNANIGAYLKRAYCYEYTGKIKDAEKDFLKAISLARLDQNKHHLTNSYISLADFYRNQKQYLNAEEYYLLAETEAKDNRNNEALEKIYKGLANIKTAEKKFESALAYASKASKEADIQKELNVNEKIIELEKKYETSKKTQEIELLKAKNEVAEKQKYIYIAIAGLLLVSGLFLFFGYRNKIKTAQKLNELNELKSRFFANISHEFRTPLTLIKSPVQQLQSNLTDKEQNKQLQLIDSNANRMLELVDQLLELSKIDSGNLQIILKKGNLQHFFQSIVEPFSFKAKDENQVFTSTIENLDFETHFDKDIITKITTNLLDNAFKYNDNGKPIDFIVKNENENLIIQVHNYNSQLKEADYKKLFERFYQKDNAISGFGIGLALVKDLVELYDGTIKTDFSNQQISFTVELPLKKDLTNAVVINENTEVTSETITPIQVSSNPELPILLVVDDNASIREVIKDIFASNYQILEAANGKEALKLAQKEIPDCIISDVMMPEMDGFEFTNQIKSNELTSFIPVILVTAKSSDEAHLKALQNTADAFLTKPFNHEVLKATVSQQIQERKKLQERYSQELILKPTEVVINSVDEKFIAKLETVLENAIPNSEFNAETFAEEMHMSRMQLHRKLKSLFGVSATEFIRNERLKMAADLLKNQKLNVSDIAYNVGFNDVGYFSKCFKEMYQISPSDYQKK
ncbi:MAG: response regulator [Flavobacteriaceae bacterium]|nr:response regulator [Flavobacteriaceae bacterium]